MDMMCLTLTPKTEMGGNGESFESNKDGKRRQGQVDPIFNAWTFLLADAEDEMNFPPPWRNPIFIRYSSLFRGNYQ